MSTDLDAGPAAGPRPFQASVPVAGDVPDPHGQAALLLAESLIHRLKERGILSVAEAVDVIETAADVQYDLADAADGAGSSMRRAAALLMVMANSLRHDLEDGEGGE